MEQKGAIKRVFPGSNTPQGFFSFYDYIAPPDATRVFVIKGGPGVGKSTFIRHIAAEMLKRGYNVEIHHCASDNASLDAVVVPAAGIALIDGTAPHVYDPRHPGCIDEIIHLGDFWDEEQLRAHRDDILAASREVADNFQRAYRFLRAAKAVYDDWENANQTAMDYGLANCKAYSLVQDLFGKTPVAPTMGADRHLFANAITPEGATHYLDTIIKPCRRVYVIAGKPGTGKSTLLRKVATAAQERGYAVELYHCSLDPNKVEHVVIPALSVALTKSIEPHAYQPATGDTVIDMNECLHPALVEKYRYLVTENQGIFADLFARAIRFIARAKEAHDEIEQYYVTNMDFDAISQLCDDTLGRILVYAWEKNGSRGDLRYI